MNWLWLLFLLPVAAIALTVWVFIGMQQSMNRNDNHPSTISETTPK